ncbi:TNT domain-containing protein [Sphingomonas sanguinis]|uniref:TNT domain-containing protein n=1 Tax=Sphingomonas sanguinis TaxID=33051 RepID=UPI001C561A1C|nr:TNT domain-containing protein [Sphingomonas sanguinis]QXT34429.1 TNT domain-containing protein [Sphingomonas sanguinis]
MIEADATGGQSDGVALNPERRITYSRLVNEIWARGFTVLNDARIAETGREFTDAPELRAAYSQRDVELARAEGLADANVNQILFAGLGAPLAIGGGLASGGLLLAGGGGFGSTLGTAVSVDFAQANVRGYLNGRFTQQSTVGGTTISALTNGRLGEGAYALGTLGVGVAGLAKSGLQRFGIGATNAAESTVAAGETRAGTALQTYWPPNRGFQGAPITEELATGARIDRYGYEGGTFLAPEGTPDWMRSLAPGTTSKPYNLYEVVHPIEVQSGKAAPWFNQIGGGTQYELPMSVSDAIAKGHLRRVGP